MTYVDVYCTSSVLDHREFESPSDQTKDNKTGICNVCYFSSKHTVLRSKSKDRWGRNWVDVSERSNMSTYNLLFQWTSVIKILLNMFVSSNVACYRHDIQCSWKIVHLALNNNQSPTRSNKHWKFNNKRHKMSINHRHYNRV